MKFNYYPETDSLYISLSDKSSVDSQEIAPNIVLDFDEEGKLVGIDIEDKGGYLNIIDEDGIITTLMGEEREKFLFCLST